MFKLRPSSSKIWTNCAAMPRFSDALPEQPPSDAAREGTCAAWVAEKVMKGEADDAWFMVGASHNNDWVVDAEMAQHVQGYIDHLRSYGGEVHIERMVTLNEMIKGVPDAFAVLVDTGSGMYDVVVDDLKYGYKIVEPYKNTQVSIYAGAILNKVLPKVRVRKVRIGIYQPRAFHPEDVYRTWSPYPEELMKFVKEIENAGVKAQSPMSEATPGDYCEFCPAAAKCTALAHTAYKAFTVINDTRDRTLTSDEMSRELDFILRAEKIISARKDAIVTEATSRMKQAEHIPGYGFEDRYGRKKFDRDMLGIISATGVYPMEEKLCTPAELIRRGADKDVVESITSSPRISPKLVKFKPDYFNKLFEGKDGK